MSQTETPLALPELPAVARRIVDQLLTGELLGASRNIRQINDLFVIIAGQWPTQSSTELVAALRATGDYLAATRGRNTPAIANAIRLVLKDIEQAAGMPMAEVRQLVEARRAEFNALSLSNANLIAEYGANSLAHCEAVVAFDYSSSQLAVLRRLAERGRHLRVIVPESRCLDGGRPVAREAAACGHSVVFFPDMAFSHFLRRADAVLIGAETILANGDCWNTIGSYPLAVMADRVGVPYYVATELLKIDPLSFTGQQRPIRPRDYSDLLSYPGAFAHPELISVTAPDLDVVPGSLIRAYITPVGVILPQHLWAETRKFLAASGGEEPG